MPAAALPTPRKRKPPDRLIDEAPFASRPRRGLKHAGDPASGDGDDDGDDDDNNNDDDDDDDAGGKPSRRGSRATTKASKSKPPAGEEVYDLVGSREKGDEEGEEGGDSGVGDDEEGEDEEQEGSDDEDVVTFCAICNRSGPRGGEGALLCDGDGCVHVCARGFDALPVVKPDWTLY